jgi:beta-galactosidase
MQRNSELKWKVKYKPGVLSAKGYTGGKLQAETQIETVGAAAAVTLKPNRTAIRADGEDVAVITVEVTDKRGQIAPLADDDVTFELQGPGRIIGVGNGDPSSHEPDVVVPVLPLRTQELSDWRWKKVADTEAKDLPELAAQFDDAQWEKADVKAESGPLLPSEKAVFRGHFTVTAQNLAASAVELWFGKIEGSGAVYLNGQKIADNGDAKAASLFDVKTLVRAGENTIAVTLANYGATAGLNKGAVLRFQDGPLPVQWRRKVFNGLAQVIVQSTKASGRLAVTARAPGRESASISINTTAPELIRATAP